MKKLFAVLALITLALIALTASYFFWLNQNRFIVIIDEHDSLDISPDKKALEDFFKINLPQKSKVIADNQTGQPIGTDRLNQVRIILTDEVQKNFAIKYADETSPVISSGISVSDNVITIRVYINDNYVENTNGSWLFTSSLAHTTLYMRDITKFTQAPPPEIFRAYSRTIPVPEVTSLLENGTRFGQISRQ